MSTRVEMSVISGARPELIAAFLRSVYNTVDPRRTDLQIAATINWKDPELAVRLGADAQDAGWHDRLHVKTNPFPKGFAANHNAVMQHTVADLFLLANDDIILRDAAVETLVAFMQDPANSRVAVVSPMLLNEDGTLQRSTSAFPTIPRTLLSISGLRSSAPVAKAMALVGKLPRFAEGRTAHWAHDETRAVQTLAGAFMLVRSAALREVGVMDEVAIAGGEETEWHKRMADHHWAVVFYPRVAVIHLGSQTVSIDPRMQLEYVRGWFNYFHKHAPRSRVRLLASAATGVYAAKWLGARARRDAGAKQRAADGMRMSRKFFRAPKNR